MFLQRENIIVTLRQIVLRLHSHGKRNLDVHFLQRIYTKPFRLGNLTRTFLKFWTYQIVVGFARKFCVAANFRAAGWGFKTLLRYFTLCWPFIKCFCWIQWIFFFKNKMITVLEPRALALEEMIPQRHKYTANREIIKFTLIHASVILSVSLNSVKIGSI